MPSKLNPITISWSIKKDEQAGNDMLERALVSLLLYKKKIKENEIKWNSRKEIHHVSGDWRTEIDMRSGITKKAWDDQH